MGREQKDLEKLFSENVDRLVAGEELKADAGAGEGVGSALDFARKIIATTPGLSADFEAQLQVKLLQKLAEQEAVKKGWFWKLIPHQPVWQAVAAFVFVAMIGVAVWMSGIQNPPEPLTNSGVLHIEAKTDKAIYEPGEKVEVEVSLKNVTSEPLLIEQFPPMLSLMQENSRQPVFTYGAGADSTTLPSGGEVRFTVSWNQRDATGSYVAAGGYYLELEDIAYQGESIKLTLIMPVGFDILPVSRDIGEIYKTIDLNQAQTVAGITVTLQRLELSNEGARISAIISPPLKAGDYAAYATYYLDSGWVKDGGLSSVEKSSSGMKHTWYFTEPIPRETGELLFIVMNVGNLEGPWQFRVPLGQYK